MATVTVKIPAELERSVAQAARRERVTKSELVRRAMRQYVEKKDKGIRRRSALDAAGALVGSVRGAPADLSTNAQHLEEYGK